MKIRLYENEFGWSTQVKNYKNKDDKTYCNFYFNRDCEPNGKLVNVNGREFTYADVDVIDWGLACNKGKIGIKVWKWEPTEIEFKKEPYTHDDVSSIMKPVGEPDKSVSMNGQIKLNTDDLPFF